MGVNILTRNSPPNAGANNSTGTLFVAGPFAISGDTLDSPVLCHDISDFESGFNTSRSASSSTAIWDYLDVAFREGVTSAYVVDYGAESLTATSLSATLATGSPITSLAVTATSGTTWPTGTLVVLAQAGHTQVFTTTAAVPSGSTSIPVVSQTPNFAYPLTTTTVTPSLAGVGLSSFNTYLGPGQAALVGESPSLAIYTALQQHADAFGRIGLLDVASTDNTAALMEAEGTIAQSISSLNNLGLFGSWASVPAPAGVIGGTSRTVPASAVIAGMCNRVDQSIGLNGIANYNQPAGGRSFPMQYATGMVFDPILASDQSALFAKGVNFFHNAWGVLENYGFVTPLYAGSPISTTPFWQLNCSRALMWLKYQAALIGENYYMMDIDSQGKLAGKLKSDLMNICKLLYDAGGLFGDPPGGANPAYNVSVGVSVNSTQTASQGTLNAVLQAKFSQYAQTVNITLVSVPVQGSVL